MHMNTIEINGQTINYVIRRHKLAKRLRITVGQDGRVRLTLPRGISERTGRHFMVRQGEWICQALAGVEGRKNNIIATDDSYKKDKEKARRFVQARLEYFNRFYGFEYGRVSIRNQKTRWGSCSSRGNLNFSFKLYYLPQELADYIIVHELCHLGEMNHSNRFWRLVERTIPDYGCLKKRLKRLVL